MRALGEESVLVGVPPLRFWGEGAVGWYCLAGAVTRYMEYLGDPVSYAELMGVSGAAWRLIWNEGQSSPDNLIMAWYGPSLAERRIAGALGYNYAFLDRGSTAGRAAEEAVTARICAEIDAGRPAIAVGIAGPEECLVAGYRECGKDLLVRSFFESSDDYLAVRDWYAHPSFLGLHLFTRAAERKSARQNLIDALRVAVEMGRTREAGGRAAGLAAYEAWQRDMLRDDLYPRDDADDLAQRCLGIGDNGIIVLCARSVAADYLRAMVTEVGDEARAHLLAAASLLKHESEAMGAAHDLVPWGNVRGDALLARTDRATREALAGVIGQCGDLYAGAMVEIERALYAEGIAV